VQLIFATACAADFHLAAPKSSFADNAKTLVVERAPGSKSIFSAQDREAIVEFEMRVHNAKAFWPSHRNAQSGRWMIRWMIG
jgi:hypothetical protein